MSALSPINKSSGSNLVSFNWNEGSRAAMKGASWSNLSIVVTWRLTMVANVSHNLCGLQIVIYNVALWILFPWNSKPYLYHVSKIQKYHWVMAKSYFLDSTSSRFWTYRLFYNPLDVKIPPVYWMMFHWYIWKYPSKIVIDEMQLLMKMY